MKNKYLQKYKVHGDFRLMFGTAEQKVAVLASIKRRSEAAIRGWEKRRMNSQ